MVVEKLRRKIESNYDKLITDDEDELIEEEIEDIEEEIEEGE